MLRYVGTAACLWLGLFAPQAAVSGGVAPPPPSATSKDDTALFAGLNWRFGDKTTLEGVVGLSHSSIDSDGDVEGARLSLTFDALRRGVSPSARLSGFTGQSDFAAEGGVGLSFDGRPFLILGAFGDNYNFGGLLGTDGSVSGYVGAHSYTFDDPPSAPGPVITLLP